jgi:hypothetical protein
MTTFATTSTPLIDARGARFAALLTTGVLAATLIFSAPALLLVQSALFAIGAFLGPQRTPYAALFRRFVAPRLAGSPDPEPVQPPQFAQAVGLGFAVLGLLGAVVAPALFLVATAMAFAAAFLNAAFGFCLGCRLYLLIARARG